MDLSLRKDKSLISFDLKEIEEVLSSVSPGKAQVQALNIFQGIHVEGKKDLMVISNVSKSVLFSLKSYGFNIARASISNHARSVDGTHKWLVRFTDDAEVETVFIPHRGARGTLCLSSQVGCTLNCTFCHTGTQKCVRNLTADEILMQFMMAQDHLRGWKVNSVDRPISNVVMMGMGEPLLNYENVAKAIRVMMSPIGIALGRRSITLSTSGIVPFIDRCGVELGVLLAISLHATNDEVRNKIMPINRKYPIRELLSACSRYVGLRNSRRITFEYVMLSGINDSDKDAGDLVKLLRSIPARVNLIPFNPWKGSFYQCSPRERILGFMETLHKSSVPVSIRESRGQDIMAACGQLKSATLAKRMAKIA